MVTQQPPLPVVWMDNGCNTEATYRFADEVTKPAGPEPRRSGRHPAAAPCARHPRGGGRPHPALDDPTPRRAEVTAEVKAEPFARALRETAPEVWFTALRATDTAVRARWSPSASTPTGSSNGRCCTGRPKTCTSTACTACPTTSTTDPTKGEDNREAAAACTSPTLPPGPTMNARTDSEPPCLRKPTI